MYSNLFIDVGFLFVESRDNGLDSFFFFRDGFGDDTDPCRVIRRIRIAAINHAHQSANQLFQDAFAAFAAPRPPPRLVGSSKMSSRIRVCSRSNSSAFTWLNASSSLESSAVAFLLYMNKP